MLLLLAACAAKHPQAITSPTPSLATQDAAHVEVMTEAGTCDRRIPTDFATMTYIRVKTTGPILVDEVLITEGAVRQHGSRLDYSVGDYGNYTVTWGYNPRDPRRLRPGAKHVNEPIMVEDPTFDMRISSVYAEDCLPMPNAVESVGYWDLTVGGHFTVRP